MICTAQRTMRLQQSRVFLFALTAVNPIGGGMRRGDISNRGSAP